MKRLFLALACIGVMSGAQAEDQSASQYQNLLSPLLSTSTDIIGNAIAYPAAPGEVTAAEVTIPPGGTTGWHRHEVPLFAHILEGELTVDYGTKGTRVYRAGDSVMEAMDWPHNGTNTGDVPMRLLAVYMGGGGKANAVAEFCAVRTVVIEPLTRETYAPFGQVIEVDGAEHFPINNGMTERYHDLAEIELAGVAPRPLISIARGKPYELPLTLTLMERHPLGSQAFYPLSQRPFLSIVAPDEAGRPGTPRAFLCGLGQGINMAMNTWHAVLTPLQAEADFLMIDRGGEGTNLEEHIFDTPWLIVDP